jgi:hypothetical protein
MSPAHGTLTVRRFAQWTSRCFVALLGLVLAASSAASAQASAPGENVRRPAAQATRREGPVAVDGRLDEAAWLAATPITSFTQQDPDEGAPPSERTEIRILYDDDALYVAARMYDGNPAAVHGVLTRRDQLINSASGETDKLVVSFDTYRNNVDETLFELNPRGVKGDAQNGDAAFDPVWEGVARTDSAGWTAELRIPLSQLHFPQRERQLWGMQIVRLIARRHERDMWAFWRKSEFGGPARFGVLQGIVTTSPGRPLEVMPYATARGTFSRAAAADPFHSNGDTRYRVGGDVKMNVTSNLALDATINPDFGQVEVDPAVVNLSAFETTLLEKRPFFTAGSQYFALGAPPCMMCFLNPTAVGFYSRRVGRSPQLLGLVEPSAAYLDAPDATSIPAALKLTGRRRSRRGRARAAGAIHARRRCGGRVAGDRAAHELFRRASAPGHPRRTVRRGRARDAHRSAARQLARALVAP